MDEYSLPTVHPADMVVYRATARRQKARRQQALARRQKRAWDLARYAATLLKEHFDASRVVVFGSLIHADCFTLWSDVDIAAWGIAPHDTFRAIGAVHDLATDMAVNLVDVGACQPTICTVIEQEGVELR
jgi:predicted nucleotidyltransferase